MIKNFVLVPSLLINGMIAYAYFSPPTSNAARMTCDQARNEIKNGRAVNEYARANGGSLAKTHDFLTNSDFSLRNIAVIDDTVSFIYTGGYFPSICGLHLPGVDGSIVRIRTDLKADPQVTMVH